VLHDLSEISRLKRLRVPLDKRNELMCSEGAYVLNAVADVAEIICDLLKLVLG
jgi:hypothetical protein